MQKLVIHLRGADSSRARGPGPCPSVSPGACTGRSRPAGPGRASRGLCPPSQGCKLTLEARERGQGVGPRPTPPPVPLDGARRPEAQRARPSPSPPPSAATAVTGLRFRPESGGGWIRILNIFQQAENISFFIENTKVFFWSIRQILIGFAFPNE